MAFQSTRHNYAVKYFEDMLFFNNIHTMHIRACTMWSLYCELIVWYIQQSVIAMLYTLSWYIGTEERSAIYLLYWHLKSYIKQCSLKQTFIRFINLQSAHSPYCAYIWWLRLMIRYCTTVFAITSIALPRKAQWFPLPLCSFPLTEIKLPQTGNTICVRSNILPNGSFHMRIIFE